MNQFELELGKGYTKTDLEGIFATNFGARIKGITLRRDNDDSPYAIVFSRATGPYSDRIEGTSFYYDGEGRDKDQELTSANKALTEANDTGRTLYGFRQDEDAGLWHYLGILSVIDFSYVKKNEFFTYEFHFKTVPVSPAELVKATNELSKTVSIEPVLTEKTRKVNTTLTARSAAFSREVKRAYENYCAVCKIRRFSVSGYPEVEAAHIYPKEKDGSDDFRNGVALCKLHHWAFDSGLIALSDDLVVIVKESILSDENYKDIYRYANSRILDSNKLEVSPHRIYLNAHRELHGFH